MADITWADFYAAVRDEANKGKTLDNIIPQKVFQSLRTLEQNYSYKWNEVLLKFLIRADSDNPNLLELPNDFKSLIALNLSTSGFENCMRSLQEQDPSEFSFSAFKTPYGFWNQGNRILWLDGNVKEDTDGFLWYNRFTLKDELKDDGTNPMLVHGFQALLGMTMQNLAAYCREPSWFDSYGRLTEISLKTLHIADAELRRGSETGVFGGLSDG